MAQVIKVTVGKKTYLCEVADTDEKRKLGLQNREHLAPDAGMLFIFDSDDTHEMWMKNTKIPLDLIGINDDEEVNFVFKACPNSEELIPFPDSRYILEVNAESGIKEGDEVEIDDSEEYAMKVLAPDGSTQMLLKGGERIYSRKHTLTMIRKAKRAREHESDKEEYKKLCKSLGKYMFKCIKKLDTQELEYVEKAD